jgi:hypothetical protein
MQVKQSQPKICPNCPYISFIPIILANEPSYTREKTKLTPLKLCQKMRAFAEQHNWKLQTCPYFSETETMERYVYAKASAKTR